MKIKDISGQKFGRLRAIKIAYIKHRSAYWECICDCGNTVIVYGTSLRRGLTQSCKCLQNELTIKRNTKHGYAPRNKPHTMYTIYNNMKQRCYNPNSRAYRRYGERGIIICDEWLNDFTQFLKDMGPRPSIKHSIERINNDSNYEPKNCKWATPDEQGKNMHINKYYTYNNQKKIISEWVKISGIKNSTFRMRLKYGWSIEKIIETPVKK